MLGFVHSNLLYTQALNLKTWSSYRLYHPLDSTWWIPSGILWQVLNQNLELPCEGIIGIVESSSIHAFFDFLETLFWFVDNVSLFNFHSTPWYLILSIGASHLIKLSRAWNWSSSQKVESFGLKVCQLQIWNSWKVQVRAPVERDLDNQGGIVLYDN